MSATAVALLVAALWSCLARPSSAIGVNWGTQLSHPLPASTVVRLLQDNGFDRVKLFDAEDGILHALRKSGIQVMVGIPNDMLADLAENPKVAENWVARNVTGHVHDGVDIRSVRPPYTVHTPRLTICTNTFAHILTTTTSSRQKTVFFFSLTCLIFLDTIFLKMYSRSRYNALLL